MSEPLSTDQIALAVEIPGLYDGTAVYLMRDGTLINRFAEEPGWGHLVNRVDEWITEHGDTLRAAHTDLLRPGGGDESPQPKERL